MKRKRNVQLFLAAGPFGFDVHQYLGTIIENVIGSLTQDYYELPPFGYRPCHFYSRNHIAISCNYIPPVEGASVRHPKVLLER